MLSLVVVLTVAAGLLAVWHTRAIPFPVALAIAVAFVLLMLSSTPAYLPLREGFPDLFKFIVALGLAIITGVFGAVYLAGLTSTTTDRDQVGQLIDAARSDLGHTRIGAQSIALVHLKSQSSNLSDAFRRASVPLPERFFKIASEPIVMRTVHRETLNLLTASEKNLRLLADSINSKQQTDDNVKLNVVIYVDTIASLEAFLPFEQLRLDGKLDDKQLHELHQQLIGETLATMNKEFVQKAFENTNLIVDRRMNWAEAGYKRYSR